MCLSGSNEPNNTDKISRDRTASAAAGYRARERVEENLKKKHEKEKGKNLEDALG